MTTIKIALPGGKGTFDVTIASEVNDGSDDDNSVIENRFSRVLADHIAELLTRTGAKVKILSD